MRYEKVLLDVETQRDFFSPGGACYTPAAVEAARNIRRLFAWARRDNLPVISTVLRLKPGRKGPLGPAPHCIEDTAGEKRVNGTLLRRYVDMGIRNTTDLPDDLFRRCQQVIFEKRFTDIFVHVRAERLLTELQADTFVVCGAGSAHGIVEAVVGLRSRGCKVVLATDAILDLDDPQAKMAWLRMLAKGAVPLTTDEVVAQARHVRPAARHFAAGLLARKDAATVSAEEEEVRSS